MDFYILINAVMGDERLWLGESRPLWGSDIEMRIEGGGSAFQRQMAGN